MGDREYGVDPKTVLAIAREVVEVRSSGTELAIVVGGGNFYRGMAAAADGMDRATADYAGMLATLLNALALQDALEKLGVPTRACSPRSPSRRSQSRTSAAARCATSRRAASSCSRPARAIRSSPPTRPAALRALEIGAEAILMAKNGVQGVYDGDPRTDPTARSCPRSRTSRRSSAACG